ncbi:MAG: hypothetical protein CI952_49 [Methanohalophilus sp.]|nr:MAG: hypothetical protein CI952_49 [Methanohalophilus sp.]
MTDDKISDVTDAIKAPNCRICNHPRRSDVDQMLILGVRYKDIIKNLGAEGSELNTKILSNHKNKHINADQVPDVIPSTIQAGLVDAHQRAFELQFENQRLRSENMLADQKMRMTQQAAVCLTIIDQLPQVLETATVKDVLNATKMLSEICGDRVEKHEHQIDVVADMNMDEDTLKAIGDILASGKKK